MEKSPSSVWDKRPIESYSKKAEALRQYRQSAGPKLSTNGPHMTDFSRDGPQPLQAST